MSSTTIKLFIIILYVLMEAFGAFVEYVNKRYQQGELPENVRDVYDEKEYKAWMSYEKESGRISLVENITQMIIILFMLIFNLHAFIFEHMPGRNIYFQYFVMTAVISTLNAIISCPFDYYDTFVIEEKYGMNKTTNKTFSYQRAETIE